MCSINSYATSFTPVLVGFLFVISARLMCVSHLEVHRLLCRVSMIMYANMAEVIIGIEKDVRYRTQFIDVEIKVITMYPIYSSLPLSE